MNNLRKKELSLIIRKRYGTVGDRDNAVVLYIENIIDIFTTNLIEDFHKISYDADAEETLERAIQRATEKL